MEEMPVVFRSPRAIRVLNVIAVGASVAACTTGAFMYLLKPHEWTWALIAGLPTAACAALWAVCLRWRKTTKTGVRYGWLLSVPLAALNSALSGGAFLAIDAAGFGTDAGGASIGGFVGGALLGGTFGVVVWLPALIAVLAMFGGPIAHAQKMARLGVAGEERGEVLVGAVAAALGAIALAVAWLAHASPSAYVPHLWSAGSFVGQILMHALALAGVTCGVAAAWIALLREARRRRFVERVEASEVPGFRVEKSTLGKVLLRVAPVPHYRVADVAEELFELDETGSVTHSVQGASRSQSA
ncbi:MAG TPA: hypothetical protein VH054_16340 [Polyangiaceae bacterium]|jgi:hypothetical protein|nr:hypothetical protein [Polyangiaceae bacterium]